MKRPYGYLWLIGFTIWLLAGCAPSIVPSLTPAAPFATTGPTILTATLQNPKPAATALPTAQPTQLAPKAVAGPVWKELVKGLPKPVDLAEIPDGSGKLAIVEQAGMIKIIGKDGITAPGLFLDIHNRVGSQGTEQGLLGLAFHPKYADNGFFFVNYTDLNGNTVISRFTGAAKAEQVDTATEKILLQVKQPYPNHNGGGVVFGPDGYLYLSLGDGGSGGDPQNHAQSLDTMLGKILRIDVNQGERYAIPSDNPFAKGGGLPEIWAYGLRNPWRFSFDLNTHDLFIADVGQDTYEEVDFVPAGSGAGYNYEWRYREGLHPFKNDPPANLKLVDPVWEYAHDQGCSISGGYVYRGKLVPDLTGTYLAGDYCSGRIWGLKRSGTGAWQSQVLFNTDASISSFGQDLNGEIYMLDLRQGRVFRLEQN
jgi:glucose/arabinose dehydrogenase